MNHRINLMYVIYSFNNGGAETLAIRLAEKLEGDQFRTVVCSLSDQGPLRDLLISRQMTFCSLGKREGKDLRIIKRLRQTIREHDIDIVHTHNQGPLLYTVPATSFLRRRLLVHTEHINMLKEFSYNKRHLLYNNLLYRRLDGFVSIAHHLTEDFRAQYDLRRALVKTIPNCVESMERQSSPLPSLRRELGLAENTQVIGNISALRKQKDHETLIRAMKFVREVFPDAALVIAGDGELQEELLRLRAELNLTGTVHFLGYRSDVNQLLAQFDIFVLSSLYEGLPLCVLEAMSAGKPIVVTDADGTNELIEDGVTGVKVPVGDPERFGAAIISLLSHPERARVFGEAARRHVSEHYNMDGMIGQYKSFYRDLYLSSKQ